MILNPTFRTLTILELLKSFRTVTVDWVFKSPLEKFSYLYSLGKAFFRLALIPLFENDQGLSWYSYFMWSYAGTEIGLSVYTIYNYAAQGELPKSLPSTCIIAGPVLACLTALRVLLSEDRKKLNSLMNFAARYLLHNNRENFEYSRICDEEMNILMRKWILKILLLLAGGFCCELGPIYYYVEREVKTTTTNMSIPFVDEASEAEFLWNVFFQAITYAHGLLVYVGFEIALTIFGSISKTIPKLVQYELKKIIMEYEENEMTPLQLRIACRNLVLQCLDYVSFIKDLCEILYWRNFLITPLFIYAIGMSIYCQYTMDFGAGYGMGLMSWVQFLYICDLGESIESNGFAELLYETDWYKLPISLQKNLILVINHLKNGPKLTIGPFGVINRELFNVVTNKIYSFVMFLLNFGN